MSFCRPCRRYYREPPGEEGDHPCPSCGRLPHERVDRNEPDDDDYEESE
jgi:hypothetical protein